MEIYRNCKVNNNIINVCQRAGKMWQHVQKKNFFFGF